ncbi:ABC transporter substrate-binding protein [Marinobacter daepoensis]|uniref:substrate-binding periplasmic protein n=1 Tax=Marinobacter daepoensis TaxID=262077 RepID=UPI001C96B98C|nr:ABC transporter substrate-binding protein [Marinobacter daepoensis]MBY6034115.1 ABC transporter substrate-binding protein [Marinobacter daepoensis]
MKFSLYGLLVGALLFVSMNSSAHVITVLAPEVPANSERDGTGRDLEIFSAVMERCGREVRFEFSPFLRHLRNYTHEHMGDAVMTVDTFRDAPGFATIPYVFYQNGVVVLDSADVKPYSLSSLEGLRVVYFPGAPRLLGFDARHHGFADSFAFLDERVHARVLFYGRADAVLTDGLIFSEITRNLNTSHAFGQELDPTQKVMFIPIFPPSPYRAFFRSEALRDEFNRCLRILEGEGEVKAINIKYVDEHRDMLGYGYLGY